MPKKIKVSTITPCYKAEKYLKKFLEEVPKQTMFENIEIVLDHNDPSEQELKWVEEFKNKYPGHLKHIITTPVQSYGASMNTCIKAASGNLIAIWNTDDLRTPDSLNIQMNLIDEEHGLSHGNFVIVNAFGKTEGKHIDHSMYFDNHPEATRGMVFGPFFMFKKELVNKIGYIDEQFKSGADFDFTVRLSTVTKPAATKEILGYYLDEQKGLSTRGDNVQPVERTVVEMRYGIFDKIEKQYLPQAVANYDIRHIHVGGKKHSVKQYIVDYENFITTNKEPKK